jgi:hypothetical protein
MTTEEMTTEEVARRWAELAQHTVGWEHLTEPERAAVVRYTQATAAVLEDCFETVKLYEDPFTTDAALYRGCGLTDREPLDACVDICRWLAKWRAAIDTLTEDLAGLETSEAANLVALLEQERWMRCLVLTLRALGQVLVADSPWCRNVDSDEAEALHRLLAVPR